MSSAFGHSFAPVAVIPSVPNDASIMRLIGAVLHEQNDKWRTSSRCMLVESFAQIDTEEIGRILGTTTKAVCSFPRAIREAPPA